MWRKGNRIFFSNGSATVSTLCIEIASFSERGEFKTSIPVYAEGAYVTFLASWAYMQTAANLCDGDLVHMHVLDEDSPIVMRGSSKNVTSVVMTMAY